MHMCECLCAVHVWVSVCIVCVCACVCIHVFVFVCLLAMHVRLCIHVCEYLCRSGGVRCKSFVQMIVIRRDVRWGGEIIHPASVFCFMLQNIYCLSKTNVLAFDKETKRTKYDCSLGSSSLQIGRKIGGKKCDGRTYGHLTWVGACAYKRGVCLQNRVLKNVQRIPLQGDIVQLYFIISFWRTSKN